MEALSSVLTILKPRHRRLVDALYPLRTTSEGRDVTLQEDCMEKLLLYSIPSRTNSHGPERLHRIGMYLLRRLSRDLQREKYNDAKASKILIQLKVRIPFTRVGS